MLNAGMTSTPHSFAAPILVVGGTGMLGRPVVERLLADGAVVRALVRDPARASLPPSVELIVGDVRDPASLVPAMRGARAVHISLRATRLEDFGPVEAEGTANVARAAADAGVGRITYLSGAGVGAGDAELLPVRTKQAAENAIRASGVPYAILRATHFMESLDMFARDGKAMLLGPQPHAFHYLAAADFAGMAVRALTDPGVPSGAYELLGPQAFTMGEALRTYVRLARPDLEYAEMPVAALRPAAEASGDPALQLAVMLFEAFQRMPEAGGAEIADAALVAATTTLEAWCAARAGAANVA